MGIHDVNGANLKDAPIDISRPQEVAYEPMTDGTLKLIAAEYIAFKGPAALEGHLFISTGRPIVSASTHSTNCMSRRGSKTLPARSPATTRMSLARRPKLKAPEDTLAAFKQTAAPLKKHLESRLKPQERENHD